MSPMGAKAEAFNADKGVDVEPIGKLQIVTFLA